LPKGEENDKLDAKEFPYGFIRHKLVFESVIEIGENNECIAH
jgi:hypothetical protein